MKNKSYRINRIRLINFHNFVDETISIPNGGHLFMLGDNGSGKTTVIDAIHYALTADEGFEFNSAARVTRSRGEGRRINGVISRYNVGKGHMNPNGAVAYAVLEVIGRHGKPVVIGVGLSLNEPNGKVSRWGIIREGKLEDIPLLIEENGEFHPANRKELQKKISPSAYYSNISRYKKEIANRFFGGEDSFHDFSRLIRIGKAYREIATGAADYHTLFKQLLPEKRTELFENLIVALRDIDSENNELDELRRKLEYLKNLQEKIDFIEASRTLKLALQYILGDNAINRLEKKERAIIEKIESILGDIDENALKITESEKREVQAQKMLDHLKTKDPSGRVTQEKELTKDVAELTKELAVKQESLKKISREAKKTAANLSKKDSAYRKELEKQIKNCAGLSAKMPFPVSKLAAGLEDLLHSDTLRPPAAIDVTDFREKTSQEKNSVEKSLHEEQLRQEICRQNIEAVTAEVEELQDLDEAVPALKQYREALAFLRQKMTNPLPIFEALEWNVQTDGKARFAIESLISDEILGMILLDSDEISAVKDEFFAKFPGIRLASREVEVDNYELKPWIREAFDLKESDPSALMVLNLEMCASKEPAFEFKKEHGVISFRAHQFGVKNGSARLIGLEERRRAQAELVRIKTGELKQFEAEIRNLDRKIAVHQKNLKALNDFQNLLFEQREELVSLYSLYSQERDQLERIRERLAGIELQTTEFHRRVKDGQARLKLLRELIAEQGLEKLEEKIASAEKKLQKERQNYKALILESGQLANKKTTAEEMLVQTREEAKSASESLDEIGGKISGRIDGDLLDFIEEIYHQENFTAFEQISRRIDHVAEVLIETAARIEEGLKDKHFGASYGFAYDKKENQLTDRQNFSIYDLVERVAKIISEQEEVINERTTALFKEVIGNELVALIRENSATLKALIKDINRKLNKRYFGNNRYHLQLKQVPEYSRFITAFENYNFFNESAQDELRELLDDYRDVIVSTEVNTMPEILDYRNWYHYEMKVSTQSQDDEGETFDHRMKSIGSGGEQAVPNYLLIMTIAHFVYHYSKIHLPIMLFDEAFYGIDEERRNQLMGFATDLGLQLFVASPDQDGVRKEINFATTLVVVKDENFDVHLYPHHFENPEMRKQLSFFEEEKVVSYEFENEL